MKRAARIRKAALAGAALVFGAGAALCGPAPKPRPHCPILDDPTRLFYDVGLGFVPDSRLQSYGETAQLEVDADWEFGYYPGVGLGDVDLRLDTRSTLFPDSTEMNLPDSVTRVACNGGWTWRFTNGTGVQLRSAPGLYADIEEIDSDALAFPFSAAGIRTFNLETAGIAGLEVRPGFERTLMPILGVAWEPNERVRVDARLPRSRVSLFPVPDWSLYAGLDWDSMSYHLREKGPYEREQLTIEDCRLYGGVAVPVAGLLQASAEVGQAFSRSVEFDRGIEDQDRSVDMEDAIFVRLALGGRF